MQKNEIYRLSAEKLGADMEGVCRLDGMPVFVPGLLPGEEADVRIVKAVLDGDAEAAYERRKQHMLRLEIHYWR